MADEKEFEDIVLDSLTKILTILQNLFILEAAKTGINKAEVRKIVGVADARVTALWKHVKKDLKE